MPVINRKIIDKIARANNRGDETETHRLLCEATRKTMLEFYRRKQKPLTREEKIHVHAIQRQVEAIQRQTEAVQRQTEAIQRQVAIL